MDSQVSRRPPGASGSSPPPPPPSICPAPQSPVPPHAQEQEHLPPYTPQHPNQLPLQHHQHCPVYPQHSLQNYATPPVRPKEPQLAHATLPLLGRPDGTAAQAVSVSPNLFGPYSAVPLAAISARIPLPPTRPKPRRRYASSPSTVALHRDELSIAYNPSYADALGAAVQSSIPIFGEFEQSEIEEQSTALIVKQQTSNPSPDVLPPYASHRQLTALARNIPAQLEPMSTQRLPKRTVPLEFPTQTGGKIAKRGHGAIKIDNDEGQSLDLVEMSRSSTPDAVAMPPPSASRGPSETKAEYTKRRATERKRASRARPKTAQGGAAGSKVKSCVSNDVCRSV